MLGLVSCTNLMDTLVYPPHHTLGLRLPISRRSYNRNSPVSPEPDPILEDTPDLPDDQDVDYSIVPPDVGLNVLVDEIGCEVPSPDTPSKHGKRALCSFSSNTTLPGEDLDDYPFHVVSYGENSSCFGLPYNDHNYASSETQSRTVASVNTINSTVLTVDNEDRLALLAKLALAKDDKQSTKPVVYAHKVTASANSELGQPHEDSIPASAPASAPDFKQQPSALRIPVTKSSQDTFALVNGLHAPETRSLATTGGRALVLPSPSTVQTVTSPPTTTTTHPLPLQVHRVTSSLTPHVVLRTGVPGLQISTTVTRAPSSCSIESSTCIRCVCGYTHADGCVIQCEKCCSWLHADCIAPANGSPIPSPYICERCTAARPTPPTTLTIQRQLSNFTGKLGNGTASIRVSRTAALGTGSASGRIFVTSAVNTAASRQLHLCLPHPTGRTNIAPQVSRADIQVLPATSQLTSGTARYISLVTQSTPYITQTQPLRSSKRKQDLLTLTGNATNAGLECLPNSNGNSTETMNTQTTEMHITASNECTVSAVSPPIGTVIAKNVYTTVSEMTGSTGKMTGSSLHRLLMQCPDQQQQRRNPLANGIEEVRADGSSPLSTISSDSVRSPPLDGYEEASDLRVSDRLFDKLESMIPSNDPASAISNLSAFSSDNVPPQLSSLHRCQVVCFEFNRKGLVASEDLYPQQPVIEYRGLCMLLSEYNEMYDYRKHYNPFVLFYKTWPKMALCVDARKYGNEARFIRRSCTPNCEVKHCVSMTTDPLSGPTPRIRLLIIANRPIMRNTELTLPFDFDFMACRYLVKCACARKGCPVARWFRQTTQTETASHNSGSSSLMYSRKLPLSSRAATASNVRSHRGLVHSTQDNYSDILADSFDPDERHSSTNWTDNRLDVDNLPPVGRLWPHRTFRRVARVSSSTHRPSGITRPVGRRGRTRGRHRAVHDFGQPVRLRGSTKGLIKSTTRGRPPGGGCRLGLSGQPRRRGAQLVGRPRAHGRHSYSETYRNLYGMDESDQELESVPNMHSSVKKFLSHPRVRERRRSYAATDDGDVESGHSNQWMTSSNVLDSYADDLDVDTEPEYESDRRFPPSSNQYQANSKTRSVLSPRCTYPDENNQSSNLPEDTISTSGTMSGVERDSRRSMKSSRHQMVDPTERRKRRVSGADATTQSPPPRKTPSTQQETKKKSREEIWMDEVLRRIERMEKKQQHHHKHRLLNTEKREADEPIECAAPMDDCLSHSMDSAPDKSDPEDLSKECDSSTETVIVKPSIPDESKSEQRAQLASPDPLNSFPPISASSIPEDIQNETTHQVKITCSKEDDDADKKDTFTSNDYVQLDSGSSISPRSPTKQAEVTKNRGKQKSLRSKRRRSQTILLSDKLTPTSDGRRDSREDRWLKSQLRRIAELEDQAVATPKDKDDAALGDTLTNGADVPETDGVEQGRLEGSVNEKDLVDASHPDDAPASFLEDARTRRRRRQSSPGGQTDSSGRSNAQSPPVKCTEAYNSGILELDSEADCQLIVYRTREKDPMAKFSRNRKVGVGLGEAPNEHLPVSTVAEIDKINLSHGYPTPSTPITSTHPAPRPTKKRWLSQALMEEEDSNQNAKPEAVSTSDPIGDRAVSPEESSSMDHTLLHTPTSVITTCPLNPKKRLISQFSGTGDEQPMCVVPPSESVPNALTPPTCLPTPPAAPPDETASTSPMKQSPEKPSMELSTSHSTPLPPKKATVKQQAEQLRQQEMRKVRVSLSEYRRRRGLSSTSSVPNTVKSQGDVPKPTPPIPKQLVVEQLESILPPGLIDPGLLLEELPKYYDQLHLTPPVSTVSARIGLNLSPTAFLRNSTAPEEEVFEQSDDKANLGILTSAPEHRSIERGPRTPSEPPDDEDEDDLDAEPDNAVYGRQVNALISNAGTSNGACWPTDRFSQRTMDAPSRLYQTAYPTSDSKLVPVIAHSQFPRATGGDGGTNAGFGTSHVTSSESRLSTSSIVEPVGYSNKQVHSPCSKPMKSFGEDVTHRSGTRFRNHSSSLSASTGSPNHPSPPPPPPPPLPPALSANTLVDFESTSPADHAPQRRFSGSDVTSAYGTKDSVPETNSLEYFIRRDQEIRHWQEARSYDWDRKRGHAHRAPVAAETHTHTRHLWPQRKNAWRNSSSSNAHHHHHHHYPHHFRAGLTEKCARHVNTGVAGQLLDVEQTLHRLEDTLRAQLDRTRLALTPHNNGAPVDRTSSLNGTGCAMMANRLLSYPTEHLELNRHIGVTEQRLHSSSSPS